MRLAPRHRTYLVPIRFHPTVRSTAILILMVWCIAQYLSFSYGQTIHRGMMVVTHFAATDNLSNTVAELYDTRKTGRAPRGKDWCVDDPSIVRTPPTWTLANMGQVFGLAFDSMGNVYFGASDVYSLSNIYPIAHTQQVGPAGPAGIYRADGEHAANIHILIHTVDTSVLPPLPSTTIPNTGGRGNGIGNIAYDVEHHQLFATNLEDGRIYRIDLKRSPAQVVSVYDPFALDDGSKGITIEEEQVWGIAIHTDSNGVTRVYFARRRDPQHAGHAIYSIPLQSNGDFGGRALYRNGVYAGGEQFEFAIDTITAASSWITDMAFAEDGRLALAERGHPNRAWVIEMEQRNGRWQLSGRKFYVGGWNVLPGYDGANAAGGVDYGYLQRSTNPYAQCDSMLWATANFMSTLYSSPGFYYGVQGIHASGNLPVTAIMRGNAYTDFFIDLDNSIVEHTSPGDVEVYRTSCASSLPGPINPYLICNDLLNVSLNTDGEVELDLEILTEGRGTNPCWKLELYAPDGSVIPGTVIDCRYIGDTIRFKVVDTCVQNYCHGRLYIEDKYIPPLRCGNDTVRCSADLSPEALGFPLPNSAVITPTASDDEYLVDHWDSCGTVRLRYSDEVLNDFICEDSFKTIVRTWEAIDASGNYTRCNDTIRIIRPRIPDDLQPLHDTVIDCLDSWKATDQGTPHPDVTGYPVANGCSWLYATYEDHLIPSCGGTQKILRTWTVIDWCAPPSQRKVSTSQRIVITDTTAPSLLCTSDTLAYDTASVSPYDCFASYQVPIPNSPSAPIQVEEHCSQWKYRIYHIAHRPDDACQPDPRNKRLVGDYRRPDEAPFVLSQLDTGCHWLEYEIVDDCGNKASCTVMFYVADRRPPDIVCENHTVVTLSDDGQHILDAQALDDGSRDNCGINHFLARRVDSASTCSSTNDFAPTIHFCCDDADKRIMVELAVFDAAGNSSVCMVEVRVDDKTPPRIVPPPDMTVPCDFLWDIDSTAALFGRIAMHRDQRDSIFLTIDGRRQYMGLDGYVIDNCDRVVVEESIQHSLHCGSGVLIRRFTATDPAGNVDSAIQRITFVNRHPFSEADIHWPADIIDPPITLSCSDDAELDPSTSTRLDSAYALRNTGCADVQVTYTDRYYYQADSACFTIAREWTVIDWCRYDKHTAGIWQDTQIIRVVNSQPPVIDSPFCRDTVLCLYETVSSASPCSGQFVYQPTAVDDCTPQEAMKWYYRIDIDQAGQWSNWNPYTNSTIILPLGTHRVEWRVEDDCGNVATCTQRITVRDCKPPTVYCRDQINTVIMPESGTITLPVDHFILQSSDNCTDTSALHYSFRPNQYVDSVQFNCADLKGQRILDTTVTVYVRDEAGNIASCTAQVQIQANNHCNGHLLRLHGSVTSLGGRPLRRVHIVVQRSTPRGPDTLATGQYNSPYDLRVQKHPGQQYTITLRHEHQYLRGLSVLDLQLIQYHLLGIRPITKAWQIIAGDVNNSGDLSVADIGIIRKLLLNKWSRFRHVPSWKLYLSSTDFDDLNALRRHPNTHNFVPNPRDSVITIHWKGIKMGDVSGDFIKTRSQPQSTWQWYYVTQRVDDELYAVHFFSTSTQPTSALQLSLFTSSGTIRAILPVTLPLVDEYHHIVDHRVFIAWNAAHPVECTSTDTLFTILIASQVPPEIFIDEAALTPLSVNTQFETDRIEVVPCPATNDTPTLHRIFPNPCYGQIYLETTSPAPGSYDWTLYDLHGQLIYQYVLPIYEERATYSIKLPDNLPSGTYLFRLSHADRTIQVGRLVLIRAP